MVTASVVSIVDNTITAKLTDAPKIPGTLGVGLGFHWRPRRLQIAMRECHLGRCDGRWHPATVWLRGCSIPLPLLRRFRNVAIYNLARDDTMPDWLAQVVAEVTEGWRP